MYKENEINERYWREYTQESSKKYQEKMEELPGVNNNDGLLKGSVHGIDAPNHLMYKIGTIGCPDGRKYEFLIEYDICEPHVGIYYGAKGLTPVDMSHDDAIVKFKNEYEELKNEMILILNNTFPNKDFGERFKMTNNANDKTYWPFWISLYEEEDINQVGLRALNIIKRVYERKFIDQETVFFNEKPKKKGLHQEETAFDEMAYKKLLSILKDKAEHFELFMKLAEQKKWFFKDKRYEVAWRFYKGSSSVDFVRFMKQLFKQLTGKSVPWAQLTSLFLDSEGRAFSKDIRVQQDKSPDKDKKEDERLRAIIGELLNDC